MEHHDWHDDFNPFPDEDGLHLFQRPRISPSWLKCGLPLVSRGSCCMNPMGRLACAAKLCVLRARGKDGPGDCRLLQSPPIPHLSDPGRRSRRRPSDAEERVARTRFPMFMPELAVNLAQHFPAAVCAAENRAGGIGVHHTSP